MGLFKKKQYEITVPELPSQESDIDKKFQDAAMRNEVAEVLKELFDSGKIYMISDLSKDEIKLITRIYMIADMKNIKSWKQGLYVFIMLQLSKKRKSRVELLEAMKGNIGKTTIVDRMGNLLGRR